MESYDFAALGFLVTTFLGGGIEVTPPAVAIEIDHISKICHVTGKLGNTVFPIRIEKKGWLLEGGEGIRRFTNAL